MKNGYRVDTKIGENGKATIERHYTDHNQSYAHTNPHDHIILWDNENGHPEPQGPINYPDGAPEFKMCKGAENMALTYYHSTAEENRFETISDFKRCMYYNGEVEFEWKGVIYNIGHPKGKILIAEANKEETALWADTADEVLEYIVSGDRLRDVITRVTVRDRTI